MTLSVIFRTPDGKQRVCRAEPGQTLLKLAQGNGFDLEGACEGTLACATCHVVVDSEWYPKLSSPKDEELAMLDLAAGRARTSRLSCQIGLTEALDGLTVKLLK